MPSSEIFSADRWIDHTPGYTMMVDILDDICPAAYFRYTLLDK